MPDGNYFGFSISRAVDCMPIGILNCSRALFLQFSTTVCSRGAERWRFANNSFCAPKNYCSRSIVASLIENRREHGRERKDAEHGHGCPRAGWPPRAGKGRATSTRRAAASPPRSASEERPPRRPGRAGGATERRRSRPARATERSDPPVFDLPCPRTLESEWLSLSITRRRRAKRAALLLSSSSSSSMRSCSLRQCRCRRRKTRHVLASSVQRFSRKSFVHY